MVAQVQFDEAQVEVGRLNQQIELKDQVIRQKDEIIATQAEKFENLKVQLQEFVNEHNNQSLNHSAELQLQKQNSQNNSKLSVKDLQQQLQGIKQIELVSHQTIAQQKLKNDVLEKLLKER